MILTERQKVINEIDELVKDKWCGDYDCKFCKNKDKCIEETGCEPLMYEAVGMIVRLRERLREVKTLAKCVQSAVSEKDKDYYLADILSVVKDF